MAGVDLTTLQSIDGYIASALVDVESGMMMAGDGTALDLELASAGNTEVLKSKLRVADQLGLDEKVEDILITLQRQYHLLRPLESNEGIFLYLVLDKVKSNLAMSRHVLKKFDHSLDFS